MQCWDGAEIHFLIPSSWKASLKTFKQRLKKSMSTLVIWGRGVPGKGQDRSKIIKVRMYLTCSSNS